MENKLVKIFKKVQKIHYKVCKFNKNELNENIPYGDCRHKSELLKQLLEKEGFEVKKLKVLFNWKDLPLPKEILSILKESDSIWAHDSISVKMGRKWIKIDCKWPIELKSKGFPVTENWNGISDTEQVTRGKIEIIDADKFTKKPNIKREEAMLFAEKLNEFLSS